MIIKEKLKECAKNQLVNIEDESYEMLQKEIELIETQMESAGKINGIEDVKPATYPFVTYEAKFREDEIKDEIEVEEALSNAKDTYRGQFKVPKVVE